MKNSVLVIGLVCCLVFLYFWFFVPLPQATGQTIDQLLSSPATQSNSAHPLASTDATTFTFYLPIMARAPELYGYVTENGEPASNISVTLFIRDRYVADEVGTTKTDANGLYNFTGVSSIAACDPNPGLFDCWQYYILYRDAVSHPDRLKVWETDPITSYLQGTAQQFPTFDISTPVLLFPNEGDGVSSTIPFTWMPRAFPGENYGIVMGNWVLYLGPLVYIDNLGYTNAYTLTLAGNTCGGAPCSIYYNIPLYWYLMISNSTGYGRTWATGPFTITTATP